MKTPMIHQIQLPTMAHNTVCLIKDLDYLEVAPYALVILKLDP